jgi:hypothetical protein
MPDVYVITESDALAASLERYFKFTRGRAVIRLPYPPSGLSPADEQWTLQTFRRLADAIEVQGGEAGGAGLQGSIAIIDLWDNLLKGFEELNPLSTVGGSWAAVVAMLVLAFPEIQWVFNTPYEPPPHFLLREAHFLRESELGGRKHYMPFQTLHDKGFVPLFDPTQLRNNIRQKIKFSDEEGRWIAPYVPARPRAAASIDEEEAYAYFNAYVAYRFGFRSHVVTSYAMMAVLLADDNQAESPPPGADISLAFEDVYLSFPDQRPGSNLRARDDKREFRKLRGVPQRIFVTVGHHRTRAGRATSEANSRYLREARARGLHWRMIFKPVSGIFDVWKKSGLRRAAEFKWPPEEADYEEDYSGHSASGRLLLIASRLIQRAERVLQTTNSVPAAVHGAVLALEALEYLGHRTPTTSLEALALKHKSEVQIECMFYGIEYHMDVKSRLKEIEQEVKSVGRWFRPRTRKLSTLNAEMRILSELVLIFRNYNQFDEEQECLARVRDLYRRLWFERHKRWAWLFYPTHWYVDFLLGSLLRFGFAIGFWIISLGFLFNYFRHQDFEPDIWWHGFADSMVSFFGLQPPAELKAFASGPAILVCAYAIILGFIHLGIFISHLYSMIARR